MKSQPPNSAHTARPKISLNLFFATSVGKNWDKWALLLSRIAPNVGRLLSWTKPIVYCLLHFRWWCNGGDIELGKAQTKTTEILLQAFLQVY